MAQYTVTDNSKEFLAALPEAKLRALEAIGMQAERYAKLACVVDTGLLRNSITHALSGGEARTSNYTANRAKNGVKQSGSYSGTAPDDKQAAVYIGTNVEYAAYVETGHITTSGKQVAAQPFLKPAATEHGDEYKEIAKRYLKNG